MVARCNPRDSVAHGLDDARPFVPEHGRTARLGGSVDGVPVRVADAARAQADENLARMGCREFELGHGQRTAGLLEDDSSDLHVGRTRGMTGESRMQRHA